MPDIKPHFSMRVGFFVWDIIINPENWEVKKMKLFASKFNIVFLILFMSSTPALSGKINMWVDENGVTHFSSQPPPTDTESETIKYKERKSTRRGSSRDSFEYMRKMESRRSENIERFESEKKYEQRKIDREKRKQEREFDKAKREYEYHKKERKSYKKKYHDAYSDSSKRYYRDKLKEADEAQSRYIRLKNQSGN